MKHKVRLTVIDKNCIRNCNSSIVPIRIPALAHVIMWVTFLSFTAMKRAMVFGTVV